MTRELFWSLILTRNPHLDGEGKIAIERPSIQRLVKQAFDAGLTEGLRQSETAPKTTTNTANSAAVDELKRVFGMK
jgi:hypothetical protein